VPSQLKRAHRTHALAQPAGQAYPHLDPGRAPGTGADRQVLALHAELCSRVPDPAQRARLVGVTAATEAAWTRGAGLPVLRAHRRAVERALRDVRQATASTQSS
jgi:hypothetical protein